MSKRPDNQMEVLSPAGDLSILKTVVDAGANAVYFGGDLFGARAYANNFTMQEAGEGISYAHSRGSKAYLTVNTLLKNLEIEKKLYDYLKSYYEMGLDAVLVQDFGVMELVHDCFPDMELHISTQANITSAYGSLLLKNVGAKRIVCARELSLPEIASIYDRTGMDLECFVHGALCVCYSGQCLMSSMLGGRSGNRGRCAQPCRLEYDLFDAKGKKRRMPGPYILSPKDMNGIMDLPRLQNAGVYSLKIEGRMKKAAYAEGVVAMYRKYTDLLLSEGEERYEVDPKDLQLLYNYGNRCGFTNSYYDMRNDKDMITYVSPSHSHSAVKPAASRREQKAGSAITGYFYAKVGEPVFLTLIAGETSVTVSGVTAQEAVKAPMTEEAIAKPLKMTGASGYEMKELNLDLHGDLFIPARELKALRREALEQLSEASPKAEKEPVVVGERTAYPMRPLLSGKKTLSSGICLTTEDNRQEKLCLSYLQKSREKGILVISFDQLLKKDITDILELKEDLHRADSRLYVRLPLVIRKRNQRALLQKRDMIASLDGVMVSSFDTLGFVKEEFSDLSILADHRLYVWNDRTQQAYEKQGVGAFSVPVELNRKELRHRDLENCYLTVYGRLPLMYTANCQHKNSLGCDEKTEVLYLKDRYQKIFPVRNICSSCVNIIYNSLPTSLFGKAAEVRALSAGGIRVDFTLEGEKEVVEVLEQLTELIEGRNPGEISFSEITRGHFNRGVE